MNITPGQATKARSVPVALASDQTLAVTTSATVPTAANMLSGKFDSDDGSSGTLITIPAGRVWQGWISLNATGSVTLSGAALATKATVQVSGSGTPTPPTTTVLLDVRISVPAQGVATTGCVSNRDSMFVTLFADASNSLLVTVTKNSCSAFAATAYGVLIA